MKQFLNLTDRDIQENHARYVERLEFYKKRGFDQIKTRQSILEKILPLDGNILEIGIGRGHTTLALTIAGYQLTAIDNNPEMIMTTALNIAYEALFSSVRLFMMDVHSLSFKNESFKNIITVDFFHHINGLSETLSEINRVLKINGKVITADLSEKGRKLMKSVHKKESPIHEETNKNKDYIYSYLNSQGYELKMYNDEWHWILIGKKRKESHERK